MGQLARAAFTFAEYLELEARSSIKHEFLDGVVYAMAKGSPDHAAITGNVIRILGVALRGKKCRVFTSDLRIRVTKTGLATYPDVSVICDKIEIDPGDPKGHTAVNPTLIVEVLSPPTEDYDRGDKLAHYKRIDSLQEVVLVAHDERRVDLWRRVQGRWTSFVFRTDDVELVSLSCSLALSEIYEDPLSS